MYEYLQHAYIPRVMHKIEQIGIRNGEKQSDSYDSAHIMLYYGTTYGMNIILKRHETAFTASLSCHMIIPHPCWYILLS